MQLLTAVTISGHFASNIPPNINFKQYWMNLTHFGYHRCVKKSSCSQLSLPFLGYSPRSSGINQPCQLFYFQVVLVWISLKSDEFAIHCLDL